jgi:hypothetical protein
MILLSLRTAPVSASSGPPVRQRLTRSQARRNRVERIDIRGRVSTSDAVPLVKALLPLSLPTSLARLDPFLTLPSRCSADQGLLPYALPSSSDHRPLVIMLHVRFEEARLARDEGWSGAAAGGMRRAPHGRE